MPFDKDTLLDRRQPSRGARELPESVASEVIKEAVEQSAALSLSKRIFRMASHQHRIPVLSAFGGAYWKRGVADDTLGGDGTGTKRDKDSALKSRTKYEWENVFVVPDTLNVLVPLPDEWMDDSNITWDEVRTEVVREFAMAIDEAVFFGTNTNGTGVPVDFGEGIVNAARAAGNYVTEGSGAAEGNVTNGNSDALADLGLDIASLGETAAMAGINVDGFAAAPAFPWRLRRLRGVDGQPLLQERDGRSFLYGNDLVEVKNGSWNRDLASLLGGEWDKLAIGIRQDISIKVFDQATLTDPSGTVTYSAVQQDGKVLRATMRLGYAVANPVRKLGGQYPFYVLTDNAPESP